MPISFKDFSGGKSVKVVGTNDQLLEPTTHEQATQPNFFQKITADSKVGTATPPQRQPGQSPGSEYGATEKGIIPQSVDTIKEGAKQIFKGADANLPFTKSVSEMGSGALKVAGGALRGIFSPIEAVMKDVATLPGASQALDAIKDHVINPVSEKISDIPAVQDFVMKNPNAESNVSNAIAIATALIGGEKAPEIKAAANDAGATVAKIVGPDGPAGTAIKSVRKTVDSATGALVDTAKKATDGMVPDSGSIMNRVARLKPSDATAFEKMAGKSHGEYLSETRNFGTPEQIISKEAQKFVDSVHSTDEALAKLPGEFKDGSISDALTGLIEKAKSVSGDNIKSPYLKEVQALQAKHDAGGLNMEEINRVKRLYERNVKLGYNKLVNGDKVEQATNIDNALRHFQDDTAKNLGFENLPALKKQTQLSKFIVDKLGAQLTGQNGLNAVSLTDWIALSGGNPQSIAVLLGKKIFGSAAIQSKIASMLAKGEPLPKIEAELGLSKVKQLPAPKEGAPKSQNFVPLETKGKSTIEKPATQIRRQIQLDDTKLLPAPKDNTIYGYKNPDSIKVAPKGKSTIEITSKKGVIPSKR